MRRTTILLLVAAGCASDGSRAPIPTAAAPFDATPFVDPFIGTGGHGHTFPGATVPFGMVQLSPDTRLDGWDGCSGYHHDDEFIYGFSHTHLSGTGCSDYGDILLMPTVGDVMWNNGADGKPGYRQQFSHANETASAGAYSVVLDSGVKCELTATTRVGVHRCTFPAGTKTARVLVDLAHRDKVIESYLEIPTSHREVSGLRRSRAWAQDQRVNFVARFSKAYVAAEVPPEYDIDGEGGDLTVRSDKGVKASLTFDVSDGQPLVVTVGISAVDCDGAAKNLDAECPGFDFDAVRDAARETWRKQLGKIEVHGGADAQLRTFYTALYHCCIAPNVFSDVDGRYRGRDQQIHQADGWTQYTVFSLWDTFRTLHPLMTIIEPQRTNDWINTFLAQYREGGALPVWELAANETDCMIGYHAVPVIADAYAKGIRGYDVDEALKAMVASANRDVRGLKDYREQGFVPADKEGESVSKTLEYAYDDWCIASIEPNPWRRFAGATSGSADRSQSWKNLFDPGSGFFRPRRNNKFIEPFDPAEVNSHLTEANSWQYSTFVPHDVEGLAEMLGGREKLAARLDALFTAPSQTKGRDQADISGMIGQYAHGNEPSHNVAYLYDFVGQPWKAQERVRQILDTLYSDQPDGLCGNEDCGQMSAWYVLSALGFYPVCPGRPEYAVGSPLFAVATLHLDSGRSFTIRVAGRGSYVRGATLAGDVLKSPILPHAAIVGGGELSFEMSSQPSTWGTDAVPESSNRNAWFTPVPFVVRGDRVFTDTTEVELGCAVPGASIKFSTDGGESYEWYDKPFSVGQTTDLIALASRTAYRTGHSIDDTSKRMMARFVRMPHDWTLTLAHPYAPQYAANGPRTLVDGLRGGGDFRTGEWQGFSGVDVDATIDLGAEREITQVRVGFLQDTRSWIWFPAEVRFSASSDGKEFRELGVMTNKEDEHDENARSLVYVVNAKTRARYVRVVGRNRGECPAWHPGAGHKAWLFTDEIGIDLGE